MDFQSERRQDRRVRIDESSLVLCSQASGEIIDLGMKGLSFSHVAGFHWPEGPFSVDLVLENTTTLIEGIPCRLVLPEENPAHPHSSHWRHSITFGTLDQNQQHLLAAVLCRQEKQSQITYPRWWVTLMPSSSKADSQQTCKEAEQDDVVLHCLYCHGQAVLRGRWARATVLCTECGMESEARMYQEQIEQWQEDMIINCCAE